MVASVTLLLGGTAADFAFDPTIRDPTRLWLVDTDSPGNDLHAAMVARGLAVSHGTPGSSRLNRLAEDLVKVRLLERVNEAYFRDPDGGARPGWSLDVTFAGAEPDRRRYPHGAGYDYSRICVGGPHRGCGGTLGTQLFDPGNRNAEWECRVSRLGVFAGRICGMRLPLDPSLGPSDLRFVDGSYGLDGSAADNTRFLEVRLALDDWGVALGNVTAHEIGHALGLSHDRRRGHLMQASFSPVDLSDPGIDFSPASIRTLVADVGLAAALRATGRGRTACLAAADATLGSLARRATGIVLVDGAGRAREVLKGLPAGEARVRELVHAATRSEAPETAALAAQGGFLFTFAEATSEPPLIVPAGLATEVDALRERIGGYLGWAGDRAFLAAGLTHWHPRIATDAAIELEAALENVAIDGPTPAPAELDPAAREAIAAAISRNLAAFEDPRPLVRLAGRAGLAEAVEAILGLVDTGTEVDIVPTAAAALGVPGGRRALLDRLAKAPAGPGRTRLRRAFAMLPAATPAEVAALLADPEPPVYRAAASRLLLDGPEGIRKLEAAKADPKLATDRRAEIQRLLWRPTLRR